MMTNNDVKNDRLTIAPKRISILINSKHLLQTPHPDINPLKYSE